MINKCYVKKENFLYSVVFEYKIYDSLEKNNLN